MAGRAMITSPETMKMILIFLVEGMVMTLFMSTI